MLSSESKPRPCGRPCLRTRVSFALLLTACWPGAAHADDAEIARLLKGKGARVTESQGVVTAVAISDGAQMTDADFLQLGKLNRLRTLDLNNCLDDGRLAFLVDLAELEYLQTNLAQVTDDGLKSLARLRNLRNLKFFHPGKEFSGAGLAYLAGLPHLERLTVAGSLAFNDDGMAAVARLPHLQEFRTWHAGPTTEGIRRLKELKSLRSLYLGQRLTYKPPACPTDETLAVLAELQSLETLQIEEARLSFTALRQLRQLPALKKLTLGGIDIAPADVDRLRTELSQVKIEWTEPNETYRKRIRALFDSK